MIERRSHQLSRWWLMNSRSLTESTSITGNGMIWAGLVQRSDDPLAGLVMHTAVLGPAGRDVGDRERVAVLPDRVAALVTDQVDLNEPGDGVIPLRSGADRDRVLEQRPGLGV